MWIQKLLVTRQAVTTTQTQKAKRIATKNSFERELSSNEEEREIAGREQRNARKEKTRADKKAAREDKRRAIIEGPKAEGRLKQLERDERKAGLEDEVESLVKQLSRMSINDARYAGMYFRALKLDRDVVFAVRPPYASAFDVPAAPANQPLQPITPAPRPDRSFQTRNASEMTCFGCGEVGHGLSSCPKILDLLEKGAVRKDTNGKLVLSNGSRIRRGPTEPIADAVERQLATTHYATLGWDVPDARRVHFTTKYDTFDESEDEVLVMPAERGVKQGKTARREILDGVVMPPRPRKNERKSPPGERPGKEGMRIIPIDVKPQEYKPTDEDVIMEDKTISLPRPVMPNHRQSELPGGAKPVPVEKPRRVAPMQSKISESARPREGK
ncbi:hypothetical protein GLOTRDRAFT_134716 [Gloeophyllum trabeum ATCC 11539]|uniref:CCHC-type domain-containing protein n=1 Tax=Gloeophyllum trabeum (strain ATCC 11539 / FP-39264 / Madison 617) TaxID=670483 RepID=S7PPA7_GLOTA|nr:uncharacterized protein GLOTRDRAFT_134716 [Gloeophyllum trabeum ATCC 11539]EPQ49706.1 hypothetical protein GLOTRDRAFT_134716 [Gloeophyllum trabeum ATCC 11539]